MEQNVAPGNADVKRRLYEAATHASSEVELQRAARAWFEGPPSADEWPDFLDFFALEWVDARGRTLLERTFGTDLPPALLRWALDVRAGVFLIDGQDGGRTFARDAVNEEALELALTEPLPLRSVLVGRLLPAGPAGLWTPSGEPDLYDPMSALKRIDLVQAWRNSPRARLHERLRALRRAFITQREQRAVFVSLFSRDELLFDGPEALAEAMRGFMQRLLFEARLPSLGGRTHAELRRDGAGLSVPMVDVRAGEGLRGPCGLIFDEDEGLHFLPALQDFIDYMNNVHQVPDIVLLYANDPGVTRLPFLRHARPERLALALGLPEAPLAALLDRIKPPRPLSPSLMPGFEVGEGVAEGFSAGGSS